MFLQAFPDLLITSFGYTNNVLAGPLGTTGLFFNLYEFFGLCMANGALCGRVGAFVYVSAH
jgi:hypothetical protein